MSQFLLDTNICIFLMKGLQPLSDRTKANAQAELLISEVSFAELKYGVAKSDRQTRNQEALDRFLAGVRIVPISNVTDVFATEKARLAKAGLIIPDFDLLIGATAIAHNMILVTNNTKHFHRLHDIKLEDWTK